MRLTASPRKPGYPPKHPKPAHESPEISAKHLSDRERNPAVSVSDLYMIFSDRNGEALKMAMDGVDKDEIHERTESIVALSGISLEVMSGELFVVMGSSGSGKSTLIRCINRLIDPSAGSIKVHGLEMTELDAKRLRAARRAVISMVFQEYGLMPHRTVLRNVAWGLKLSGVSNDECLDRARSAIRTVGLERWENMLPNQLSGGMKQRVGLARALAVNTPVLLLDEPFSAVDPALRRDLEDNLLEIHDTIGKTMIFITHDIHEAIRIGDRIAIMREGSIVQIDTPDQLILHPSDDYVSQFTRDASLLESKTADSIMTEPVHVVFRDRMVSEIESMMIEKEMGYVLVVDGEYQYLGALTLQCIERALNDNDAPAGDLQMVDHEGIQGSANLQEVARYALSAEHCVPVIDEAGTLKGEIQLSALSGLISDHYLHSPTSETEVDP